MNDEKIRDAFLHLTESADGERVEENVRRKLAERETPERHHRRFPKVALAAACVLLVLAVSAGAYAVYQKITVIQVKDGVEYAYEVHIGFDEGRITLSDEVMAELPLYDSRKIDWTEGNNVGKRFESWEDVDEWLGYDLLTSDLFGEASEVNPIRLTVSFYENDEPFMLHLFGTNSLLKGEYFCCNISISIPISENCPGLVMTNFITEYADEDDDILSYTSESGIFSQIVVAKTSITGVVTAKYNAKAFVYHNGIVYEYSVFSRDRDTALQYMKDIIDSLR